MFGTDEQGEPARMLWVGDQSRPSKLKRRGAIHVRGQCGCWYVETLKRGGQKLKKRVDGKGYQGMWVSGIRTSKMGEEKRREKGRRDVGTRGNGTWSGPDTPVSDLTAGVKGGRGRYQGGHGPNFNGLGEASTAAALGRNTNDLPETSTYIGWRQWLGNMLWRRGEGKRDGEMEMER